METRFDTYLEHHGTKGQKHGLRRYQNEDGSLTEEGRKHYGVGPAREQKSVDETPKDSEKTGSKITDDQLKDGSKLLGESSKSLNSAANFIRNSRPNVKEIDTSSLSTEEMKRMLDRRRTEMAYDDLFNETRQKKQYNRAVTAGVINGVATGLGIAASALTVAMLVRNIKKT